MTRASPQQDLYKNGIFPKAVYSLQKLLHYACIFISTLFSRQQCRNSIVLHYNNTFATTVSSTQGCRHHNNIDPKSVPSVSSPQPNVTTILRIDERNKRVWVHTGSKSFIIIRYVPCNKIYRERQVC